jgi:uncharacterized protein
VDPQLIATLTGVAFVAGFVDSIAGGGGLLALPALLLSVPDPVAALATNKLQGSFGTGSAVIAYARQRHIDFRASAPLVATTFVGAVLGVLAVKFAPTALLTAALPILLIALAIYFVFSRRLSNEDARPRMGRAAYALSIAPALGFYDGIFGPGAGAFYLLGFVTLLGYGVVRASAHTRLLNFTSNIASLVTFALSGKIIWTLGLSMGAGQFLGAQLGSRMAIRHGTRLIRPLLVLVCCGMAARLLLDPANPITHYFLK